MAGLESPCCAADQALQAEAYFWYETKKKFKNQKRPQNKNKKKIKYGLKMKQQETN